MKALIVILLTIFSYLSGINPVLAVVAPNFPSCNNPSGTIKAQYDSGTHGIAGDMGTYTGKDTVYQLDNDNLIQCFCAVDGKGIQTNWWKDGSIDPEQKQILINDGWNYIPNGALWGLKEEGYYAKNANYNCGGTDGGTGGGEITSVAASTSNILGLASTGNNLYLIVSVIATTIFSLLGIFFYQKAKH